MSDYKTTEQFLLKVISMSEVLDKALSDLSKDEKINFFKKYMTGNGKSKGKIYDYIDYDNIPEDIIAFRMTHHIMDEEGESVFDAQIPEYTDGDLEPLKIKLLNPDISDDEILNLTDKYSVLNKRIRNLFVECVGRDRLRKLQESNKSEK